MSFGIMAPVFDTIILDLDDATDLAADTNILPAPPAGEGANARSGASRWNGQAAFVQCISGSARWACGGTEPAEDADGHILAEGDGLIVVLTIGMPWWVWPREAGTKLAISPADSVPTRAALIRLT